MIKTLLRLIYPHKCMLCRQIIYEMDESYICEKCYEELQAITWPRIKLWHLDIDTILEKAEEQLQEEEIPQVLGVFPLLPYTGMYRKAIIRWKYAGIRRYARGFAKLVVNELMLFDKLKIDCMIPIPLAPSRMKKRGFNQAYDLAKAIGEKTGICVIDCMRRIRDTKPQAKCNLQERSKNVKESMKCYINEEIQDKAIRNVLIIDDIYTTGSTIKECCRALQKEKCFCDSRFFVLVVGKGEI